MKVYDLLRSKPEISHCEITIEELKPDREEGYFPFLQFDTARVFVRYKGFSVNVVGLLQNGVFSYKANCYSDESPWGSQPYTTIDRLDWLVQQIIDKFSSVPKDDPSESGAISN